MNSAATRSSPRRSQAVHSRNQAAPSPAVSASRTAAVSMARRCSTAQRPSSSGWATTMRRVAPAQPFAVQSEPADDRRGGREGIEGAEQVVHERGVDVPRRADTAAGLVLRLEDLDAPPRVGQQIRGDKAVGARADHHRVRHAASRRRPRSAFLALAGPVRLHSLRQPTEHAAVPQLQQGVERGVVEQAAGTAQRVLVHDDQRVLPQGRSSKAMRAEPSQPLRASSSSRSEGRQIRTTVLPVSSMGPSSTVYSRLEPTSGQ